MKGVIFDIEGKFAHFRKIYTNSSSLSYSVPPRTTLQGLIAAMLGYERDSYYTELNSEKLHLAVKKNGPTYNMTQTLNYIKAVSSGELVKPKEHTQIPFEVIGADPAVSYRVYASGEYFDGLEKLIERLRQGYFVFPPTLGTAFFLADVDYVAQVEFERLEPTGYVPAATVLDTDLIENIGVSGDQLSLIKEKMPRDFGDERTLLPAKAYLVESSGKPVPVILKKGVSCWRVNYDGREEYLTFM